MTPPGVDDVKSLGRYIQKNYPDEGAFEHWSRNDCLLLIMRWRIDQLLEAK